MYNPKNIIKIIVIITIITSSFNPQGATNDATTQKKDYTSRSKIKRTKGKVLYHANSTATCNLILAGDVETNPGPGLPAPKCRTCNKTKTVRCNQKRLLCNHCFEITHAKCENKLHLNIQSRIPYKWTWNSCRHQVLPFYKVDINTSTYSEPDEEVSEQTQR